jgi:hypothetical protein
MNTSMQKCCAWGGPVLLVTFGLGWGLVGGFLPPIPPSTDAAGVAKFFQDDTTLLRLGLLLCLVGSPFLGPWAAAISAQLKRIEPGEHTLSNAQLVLGAAMIPSFIAPLCVWAGAAFRPDGDPEITQRLNDVAWMMWIANSYLPALQAVVIGVAILRDRRELPIFPRWYGYLSLWCVLIWMSGGLTIFFKSGVLAWNGLISWWTVAATYAVWVIAITTALLRNAIPHQEREDVTYRNSAPDPAPVHGFAAGPATPAPARPSQA